MTPKRPIIAGSAFDRRIGSIFPIFNEDGSRRRAQEDIEPPMAGRAALMGRPTRSFKLRVSPNGFDLIVDCHVRLVRRTRTLLPYGTALNVAVNYLAALDARHIVEALSRFPRVELMSGRNCTTLFVGAPRSMMDVVDQITLRLSDLIPDWQVPQRSELYLLSLHEFLEAEGDAVVAAYTKTKEQDLPPADSRRS